MMPRISRFVVTTLAAITAAGAVSHAQQTLWNDGITNEPENISYYSASPTRLSHNSLRDWGAVVASYTITGGEWRSPSLAERQGVADMTMAGLKNLGKVQVSGSFCYLNTMERGRKWSSTIGNDPDNPYIQCDSIASYGNIENFHLNAALSWQFAPRWIAGLQVGLLTGTFSDQQDPRPLNNISRIPIVLGAEFMPSGSFALGFFAGANLFRSNFTYALVDATTSRQYFLMEGMGEYYRYSSADGSSCPREYDGKTFSGGMNVKYGRNFTEIGAESGSEISRNGSSAYEFKSGDYFYNLFTLKHRSRFGNGGIKHQLAIDASIKTWNGYWYDQKRRVDIEHGNRIYYDVLSRYKNNDGMRIYGTVSYRAEDVMSWRAELGAVAETDNLTHYTAGDPRNQRWMLAGAYASGSRSLHLGKGQILLSGRFSFTTPVGTPVFASGTAFTDSRDITTKTVQPEFEFNTASRTDALIRIDYLMPFTMASSKPGIFIQASGSKYLGGQGISDIYRDTVRYSLLAGAFLRFQ